MLLTVIGSAAYSVLHNLLAPESPKTKTYEELVAALRQHYEPKPLVIANVSISIIASRGSARALPTT